MLARLLGWLRCPECAGTLQLEPLLIEAVTAGQETHLGLLHCTRRHWFPVVRGIPRLVPGALAAHWEELEYPLRSLRPELVPALSQRRAVQERTQGAWARHLAGAPARPPSIALPRAAGLLTPLLGAYGRPPEGLVVDAGCGDGTRALELGDLGPEVVALDEAPALESGQLRRFDGSHRAPERVHFVQGQLDRPPLPPRAFDLVLSVASLQRRADPHAAFDALAALVRPGGWLQVAFVPIGRPPAEEELGRTAAGRVLRSALERLPSVLGERLRRAAARAEGLDVLELLGALPGRRWPARAEVERWYLGAGLGPPGPVSLRELGLSGYGGEGEESGYVLCGRRSALSK